MYDGWPRSPPYLRDHDGSPVGGPLGSVSERPRDWEVAIEADDEQVEYRGVAGEVVQGQPGVADERSQGPVAEQRGYGEEGHGDQSYGEVGHGQGEEEVVAYRLQLLVDLEGYHHHNVAYYRDDGQKSRCKKN